MPLDDLAIPRRREDSNLRRISPHPFSKRTASRTCLLRHRERGEGDSNPRGVVSPTRSPTVRLRPDSAIPTESPPRNLHPAQSDLPSRHSAFSAWRTGRSHRRESNPPLPLYKNGAPPLVLRWQCPKAWEGIEPPGTGFADRHVAILSPRRKPEVGIEPTFFRLRNGHPTFGTSPADGREGNRTPTAGDPATSLANLRLYQCRPPCHCRKLGG